MKRKISVGLAAVLFAALLCGCAAGRVEQPGVNTIDFYYCQTDSRFDNPTGALASEHVDLGSTEITLAEILARYFEGPQTDTLQSIFPENTACTSVTVDDGVLTLDMNEAYASLTGVERTLAAACLTMTMEQIEFVDAVQIRTPAGIVTSQTPAKLSTDSYLLQDMSWLYPERTVQLYFVGQNGKLQAEKRAIAYQDPEALPQMTLQALIDGPENRQLHASVPTGTQIFAMRVTGNLCTVVLSEEFSACDTDTTRAELAVHSVVASLCSLSEIDQVQLRLVNGSALENCPIDAPLAPESTWYN